MKMLVVGGGPGGLYTALLTKRRHPSAEVLLVERNRADDTFGWGVVLSDQTVDGLRIADPESGATLAAALHHWDNIDVHIRGRVIRSSGHGFSGIGRRAMLALLQHRCRELGVELQFERDTSDVQQLAQSFGADIVIAADGSNSRVREQWSASYQPDLELRANRFVWLGTAQQFDAFTFAFEETAHGWVQAHAYQFDEAMSTFIVEMPERAWLGHGLDHMESPQAIAWCESVFEKQLQGQPLVSNAAHKRGSAQWIRFPRITCAHWVHWINADGRRIPVVLLGDAAHTAHFSIGSGTKLALEDAVQLDRTLAAVSNMQDDAALARALAEYQAVRSVEVLKLQNAARNSTEWFEHVDRYATLEPEQLAYSMLTRSQRISHENLRLRDADYIEQFEAWFAAGSNAATNTAPEPAVKAVPPMFTPYTLRGLTLPNRVVVSPMAQYSAYEDGMPSDWHLVHLGARATGGAGLVMTEMTCVAPDARITPSCPGLWNEPQLAAWTRIVRFVHEFTPARIGLQLGHAGAKGATQKMWEALDMPLASGGWPLIAPSETQYLTGVSDTARAMTRADMIRVRDEFMQATLLAERAGFDWLELHCAHGYLLSAFLSPLTNSRTDEYGGAMAARLRFPLEVFTAMRDVWPVTKPISVRISAHDWHPNGNTADDAVEIARAFRDAGADMIDVSAGQVVKDEKPTFGRMWQTPFADRIRQEVGIPTMAVGAITDADQLNGILAAGRADLVAVARPHLVNPAWTLSEAARLGYHGAEWPSQYLSGKSQLDRLLARERAEAGATLKPAKPGELT
ncbi:MAG: bifunctional salicylyl-CoA 5-hydroxylase/oxidoreductase [Phycisphaerae bacterium]|nr:bifunctional salicylyl-CoA 5-hydroxylase/oxidoreductase [Gemmatimonadaceae bacterium]